jgi:hypothetical protein
MSSRQHERRRSKDKVRLLLQRNRVNELEVLKIVEYVDPVEVVFNCSLYISRGYVNIPSSTLERATYLNYI